MIKKAFMKSVYFFTSICFLILSACTQTTSTTTSNGFDAASLKTLASDGQWHVSYFFDDANLTAQYTNCNFTFEASGKIRVVSGNDTTMGAWTTGYKGQLISMTIQFDSTDTDLDQLSKYWLMMSANNTEIKLADTATVKADTDYLTLTKN